MFIAFLLPVVAGLALGCSFLSPPAHWLAWIGLVPVAATIARRGQAAASYVGMYCGGLIFNLITTDWIRTLDGGSGMSGRSSPDWLLQAQLLALFWPLALLIGRSLVARWPLPMSFVLPTAWCIHELLLRHVWALVDHTGWHVYQIGYAIVEHHCITQIADLGGVSTLSFLVACVNGALWDAWSYWRTRDAMSELLPARRTVRFSVGLACLLLVASCGYGAWRLRETQTTDGPTVCLMPDSGLHAPLPDLPWEADAAKMPDLLLWSELVYHDRPVGSSSPEVASADITPAEEEVLASPTVADRQSFVARTDAALASIAQQYGIPIVVGYTRIDRDAVDPTRFNSVAFIDPIRGIAGSYDKVNLVPWTEFTPQAGLTRRRAMQFSHGTRYPIFELWSTSSATPYRFASAICFDVAFSDLFRRYMADDELPDFFLISSSERSDHTGRMSRHVLAMAKVRAIECRRAIVRNVKRGHSGMIDSTGRLTSESLPLVLEMPELLGPIPIERRSTLFVRWGNWIPIALVGIVLAATVTRAMRAVGRFFATRRVVAS